MEILHIKYGCSKFRGKKGQFRVVRFSSFLARNVGQGLSFHNDLGLGGGKTGKFSRKIEFFKKNPVLVMWKNEIGREYLATGLE